ncbi:MAG: folate-binding protein YgfZ [Microbacteriaceae bacterium]|nr:folate-binding protein YgfZ [Microbacteriaceae bacterium]
MSADGNPFAEQRLLAAGDAVAVLERGVVTVTGPDRLGWLDSMLSQSIDAIAPGESAEALLLDPNGRVEHAMRIVDDGVATWLIVDTAEEAAALAAWLDRMRFMKQVEVADRSADFVAVGRAGMARHAEAGVEPSVVWTDPWGRGVQPGGWQYATDPAHPAAEWSWTEALVGRSEADALGPVVPASAAEALRIAAWRPAFAAEVDERTIPHELDWLRSAVHLAKGCYRGQETVAKVHNLGHPPRRLVFLHVDGSSEVPPRHGDEVVVAGTDDVVGTVTSAANHYELGPVALAVVKRSVDPAAVLEILGAEGVRLAAAQQIVVPPDAGATADVPRIPRLGAVRRGA